ncbi:CUB domain-containing protein 1-like [Denticeps clupeoides]|uniref:CUB domain-containing protein 1-like n=1 Tax=Denticeps clupeoides TaxID=299321 RepID=UPI0010A4B18E|nr:CUB domain-containing protein 1-like [Denticeps clupeoides]
MRSPLLALCALLAARLSASQEMTVDPQVSSETTPAVPLVTSPGSEPDPTAVPTQAAEPRGRSMDVTSDATFTISKKPGAAACQACVRDSQPPSCSPPDLKLNGPLSTVLDFSCAQPEEAFRVEFNQEIECTQDQCSSDIHADSAHFPDFSRSFTWDVKVPSSMLFQLDFPDPGMRQISPSDTCPDQHTFTIILYQRTGVTNIGTFCRNGTISHIQIRYKGRVTLSLPGHILLNMSAIKVSLGPSSKSIATVEALLPRGHSLTEFFSANYPAGFPTEDQMRWNFTVPPMHNATILFLETTLPQCQMGSATVEYLQEGKAAVSKAVTDAQPVNLQGEVDMVLHNCRTTGSQPLVLRFNVSVYSSNQPRLCTVVMPEGLTLTIENRNAQSYCEMKMDSAVKEFITVLPKTSTTLSFLDCPSEDLLLTVSSTFECASLPDCSVNGALLSIPTLDSCLPAPIQKVTWLLRPPTNSTLDLASPKGGLRQSLPGQECNSGSSLFLSEADGSMLGQFCSPGSISKVQLSRNVVVSATPPATAASQVKKGRNLGNEQAALLSVSFSEGETEGMVYQLSPTISSPTLLATPGWPDGMAASSTASWLVQLPDQYDANLVLANISQPKCGVGQTSIRVQQLDTNEVVLSSTGGGDGEDQVKLSRSFSVRMSNCRPQQGGFSSLGRISLEKKGKMLMNIILAVLVAVLTIAFIVLAIVCAKKQHKKKQMKANRLSMYNPKGQLFRPADDVLRSPAGEETNVYEAIDDTMVYSHLLGDAGQNGTETDCFRPPAVDTYRSFTGPTDQKPPVPELPPDTRKPVLGMFLNTAESFVPAHTPLGPQGSLGYQDSRMVDNELYTFKSSGEPNTTCLQTKESLPLPYYDDDEWDDDEDED